MPTFNGNTIDGDFLYVVVNSTQNQATNTSTISWSLYWAFRSPAPTDRDLDNATLSIGGVQVYNVPNPYNYAANFTVRNILLGSGSRNYTHGADGNLTVTISATCKPWQNPASTISASYVLPRIQKIPGAPGTPTASSIDNVSGRVFVSWAAPVDDGGSPVNGYKIYRVSDNALLATIAGTETTVLLDLTVGTTVAFYVKSFNDAGDSVASPNSNSVLVDGNPTAAPTFSSLTNAGTTASGNLIATWTAPAASPTAITKYSIELSTDDLTWTLSKTVDAPTLSTTLTELSSGVPIPPNTSIYARLRARNAFSDRNFTTENPQWSSPSEDRSATSSGPPSAPQNFQSFTTDSDSTPITNSLRLTWSAPSSTGNPDGIQSYTVNWTSADGGGTQTVNGATTTVTIPSLVPATTYSFSITAKNSLTTGGTGPAATTTGVPSSSPGWIISEIDREFIVGTFYGAFVVRVQDDDISYFKSSGTLPLGLYFINYNEVNIEEGFLYGTPTTQGKYSFTLSSTSSGGSQQDLPFTVYVRPAVKRRTPAGQLLVAGTFKRFDGAAWIDVGTTDVSGSPIGLKRFDGTSWVLTALPGV